MQYKTGFGYDVHCLKEGLSLAIGGIIIPSEKGAVGHSDADVLIHAVCDALLGAAGLEDIGYHFPDTDPLFKGADSKLLLQQTVAMVRDRGYNISNVDVTVCLERPRIAPHKEKIKAVLSGILKIPADDINIKATTTEKLGFTGREEGVAAYAVVLLFRE